jgi:hypothetical protein
MTTLTEWGSRPQTTGYRFLGRHHDRRLRRCSAGEQCSLTAVQRAQSRGLRDDKELGEIYGSGGDVAPLVPVVTLPQGTTVDSPGVGQQLDAALAKVEAALPEASTASCASTGDRAFVSDDGRTTFALVYIPAKGGTIHGQALAPTSIRPSRSRTCRNTLPG